MSCKGYKASWENKRQLILYTHHPVSLFLIKIQKLRLFAVLKEKNRMRRKNRLNSNSFTSRRKYIFKWRSKNIKRRTKSLCIFNILHLFIPLEIFLFYLLKKFFKLNRKSNVFDSIIYISKHLACLFCLFPSYFRLLCDSINRFTMDLLFSSSFFLFT